jgi:hypothetical protein
MIMIWAVTAAAGLFWLSTAIAHRVFVPTAMMWPLIAIAATYAMHIRDQTLRMKQNDIDHLVAERDGAVAEADRGEYEWVASLRIRPKTVIEGELAGVSQEQEGSTGGQSGQGEDEEEREAP